MQPIAGDPELLNHSTVVIYPFAHHVVGSQRRARLAALEPRWVPWPARLSESDLALALEATGFFLPYVRGMLYPEVVRLQEETAAEDHLHWAQLLRQWAAEGLGAYAAELPGAGVMRLTLRPGLMCLLEDLTVAHQAFSGFSGGWTLEALELPAHCDWIDALLFPTGLGFLVLKVRLAEENPRLGSLVHLNHTLRHVHSPTRAASMPTLRLAGGEEVTVRDLMNYLTQGMAGPWAIPEEDRGLFPSRSALRAVERPYTDSEAGRSYGERCHLVSYACIDLSAPDAAGLQAGAFTRVTDRLLFECATGIGLGESVSNPVWVPSEEQAARLARDNRIALWRCWTGMVLKETLVFLGTEDISYNRRSLPRHIESDYLPLYLFTLFQKLQLFTFSTDLMHEAAYSCGRGRLSGARALAQRFVTFRSQFWFGEVTRKPQGGEMYRTFQRGLEVQCSYDLVTGSIKDVKEYHEGVWARRVQWFKDAVTYGGPVTMAVGAARMMFGDHPHVWPISAVIVLGAGLWLLLQWCWPWCWRRWRRLLGRAPGRKRPDSARAVRPRHEATLRV
jgi:hypothetical protein